MIKRFGLIGVLAIVFLGLLASCGGAGNTTGGGGGGSADGSASAQEVVANLSSGAGQLEEMNGVLNQANIIPMLQPFGAGEVTPLFVGNWSCSNEQVTGDATDADNDGIPVNATYVADCSLSDSSSSLTWHVNLTAVDNDDSDPQGGYAISGQVTWTFTSSGEDYTWTWNITHHDLVKTATGYSFTYVGNWAMSSSTHSEANMTLSYDLSGSWTPADPNATTGYWTNGTLNASGNYNLAADTMSYSISYSVNDLVLTDSCSHGIQSGSVSMSIDMNYEGGTSSCSYAAHWNDCKLLEGPNSCAGPTSR